MSFLKKKKAFFLKKTKKRKAYFKKSSTAIFIQRAKSLRLPDCDYFPTKAASSENISHYENTPIQIHWKFYHQKMAIFQIKNSDIFHISDQNIDCGYSLEPPRRGGSNEYPQSMFLSRNNKNNVYPCKPQFYYIKVGFKGVKII